MAVPLSEEYLLKEINGILDFYEPVCEDTELGGFNNQLRDDGTVYDAATKHVVGTARYTINYAMAFALFKKPRHKDLCAAGVKFLMERHWDSEHGGFTWTLDGHAIKDGQKWCYAVAFSILALSHAAMIGVEGAEAHLATVLQFAETTFYEPGHGLYIDSFDRELKTPAPYRGQNANMHMCEALLAAFQATGDRGWLERAAAVAKKICVDLTPTQGRVVEHFSAVWVPDPEKNKGIDRASEEYIFRPYGFQPGHACEWSKLLITLERLVLGEPGTESDESTEQPTKRRKTDSEVEIGSAMNPSWMVPTARLLLNEACRSGWDNTVGNGGLVYTHDETGAPLDRNKYYWGIAEMIAAAGVLHLRTEDDGYRAWYDAAWGIAQTCFVDAERGAWFPMVNQDNVRVDPHAKPGHTGLMVKSYPSKTDYHSLAACIEVLEAIRRAAPAKAAAAAEAAVLAAEEAARAQAVEMAAEALAAQMAAARAMAAQMAQATRMAQIACAAEMAAKAKAAGLPTRPTVQPTPVSDPEADARREQQANAAYAATVERHRQASVAMEARQHQRQANAEAEAEWRRQQLAQQPRQPKANQNSLFGQQDEQQERTQARRPADELVQPHLAAPGFATASEEPIDVEEKYCVAECTDPGGDMVGCDNDDCETGGGWFHLTCVGLQATPDETKQWYCPTCEPLMS